MPHFKDATNKLYFLDDAKDKDVLPSGCVQITDAEADEIRKPSPAELEQMASVAAKANLAQLDDKSIRDIRAYIAAKADAPQTLKDYEAAAAAERAKVK